MYGNPMMSDQFSLMAGGGSGMQMQPGGMGGQNPGIGMGMNPQGFPTSIHSGGGPCMGGMPGMGMNPMSAGNMM